MLSFSYYQSSLFPEFQLKLSLPETFTVYISLSFFHFYTCSYSYSFTNSYWSDTHRPTTKSAKIRLPL